MAPAAGGQFNAQAQQPTTSPGSVDAQAQRIESVQETITPRNAWIPRRVLNSRTGTAT